MKQASILYYQFIGHWYDFHAVFQILQRQAELTHLIAWAKRKRFSAPLRCYKNRLANEEIHLHYYAIHHPQMTRYARWVYEFRKMLFPIPRFYARGAAVAYRRIA